MNLFAAQAAATSAANAPAPTATAAAQQLQVAQLNATAAVQACPQAASAQMSDLTLGLFDRINALRTQQGLAALAASDQLTAAARSHTQDMANTGNVTSVGPSYITGPVGQLIYVGLAAAASNGVIYYTMVLGTQSSQQAVNPTPAAQQCTNDSKFVTDVTVPDGSHFSANTTFTKTWRIQNTGTCMWSTNYQLFFLIGDRLGGPSSISLPRNVGAGESIELSVLLTVPLARGGYRGVWQLRDVNGAAFGDRWVVYMLSTGNN